MNVWDKAGLLEDAEVQEQMCSLPPGITEEMVDAAFEVLGGSRLQIKRALYSALRAEGSA